MSVIKVFDTTLRDGEQGIGNAMSIEQKSILLKELDSLNLDVIELGFPAASSEDFRWVKTASRMQTKTKLCLFSRLKISDIKTAIEAAGGFTNFQIELLAIGSEIHLKKKRKISLNQALEEIKDAVSFIKSYGIDDIAVIFEDATRGSIELLERSAMRAIEAGVSTISLADTLGCAVPDQIESLIRKMRTIVGCETNLSIHCHNDLGLSTANTLAAMKAGVNEIQVTLGGVGERSGNCPLEEIVAVLMYHSETYGFTTKIDPVNLYKVCKKLFEVLAKELPVNKPILGEHVFSTASGIHQDGLIKDPFIYEHIQAKKFGRNRKFIFNRLSGRRVLKTILGSSCDNPHSLEAFYDFLMNIKGELSNEEVRKLYENYVAYIK